MNPHPIDLRSDTVTRPTPGMRLAMAAAEVGDDVLDFDPTTRKLEERIAALLGKEAAYFFPSGTQANETAIRLLTRPGTELLVEANAHLIHYELAGVAELSRVQIRPIATPDGVLTAELLRQALRHPSTIAPKPSAITLENTHSLAGGKVVPVAASDGVAALAAELKLPLHLDGSRLWHAAAFLKVPLERLARGATTVMVTLSKGLGCPVGSCLAFPAAARADVWEIRKRLGGGMRQAGVLAAAGLIALEEMPKRLGEDHANAKYLAAELAQIPGVRLNASKVQTNIVIFDIGETGVPSSELSKALKLHGVLMNGITASTMRAVTHYDVTRTGCEQAIAVLSGVLSETLSAHSGF